MAQGDRHPSSSHACHFKYERVLFAFLAMASMAVPSTEASSKPPSWYTVTSPRADSVTDARPVAARWVHVRLPLRVENGSPRGGAGPAQLHGCRYRHHCLPGGGGGTEYVLPKRTLTCTYAFHVAPGLIAGEGLGGVVNCRHYIGGGLIATRGGTLIALPGEF